MGEPANQPQCHLHSVKATVFPIAAIVVKHVATCFREMFNRSWIMAHQRLCQSITKCCQTLIESVWRRVAEVGE